MRKLAIAVVLVAAGCGGAGPVTGTPDELVHGAARRTLAAKTAQVDVQYADGRHRTGAVELRGDRARIVEHGEFGYREYRYLGGAWYQLGGEIGPQGEDLGGKWVRHPRLGARDDALREIQATIRSLPGVDEVTHVDGRRYHGRAGGEDVVVDLDARGRLVRLWRAGMILELSDFGTGVDVDPPAASDIYVGHD